MNYQENLEAYVEVNKEFETLREREKEIVAEINNNHIESVLKTDNSIVEVDGESFALSVVMDRDAKKKGEDKVFKFKIHSAKIYAEEKE